MAGRSEYLSEAVKDIGTGDSDWDKARDRSAMQILVPILGRRTFFPAPAHCKWLWEEMSPYRHLGERAQHTELFHVCHVPNPGWIGEKPH